MPTITIEPKLQIRLDQVARSLGKPADDIVNEAVSDHLEHLSELKLEAEIRAFEHMPPRPEGAVLRSVRCCPQRESRGCRCRLRADISACSGTFW